MIPLFSKTMNAIAHEDVERLVAEAYPEDDKVEFKQDLSSRRGTSDRSITTGDEIGGTARNKLMEEVIAFANAHGGHLILGIEETTERPARAKNIVSIPRCEDLAERLKLQIRDCIDPQLPVAHVKGIPTAPDGQGVVVIRIPQSRSAPHRIRQTLNCCIRRADRCEKMTMGEIQDLTLQRDRSLEKIEFIFEKRKIEFEKAVSSFSNVLGIRSTLVPIGSDLYIDRVHKNDKLAPYHGGITYIYGKSRSNINYPFELMGPRTILRGTQYLYDNGNYIVKKEIHSSGLIDYSILLIGRESDNLTVYSEWFLGLAANSMITAHRFRCAAGASDCEYGIELELFRNGGMLLVDKYTDRKLFLNRGEMESNPIVFPRLSLGTYTEISKLVNILRVDFYDAAGINKHEEDFEISIPEE